LAKLGFNCAVDGSELGHGGVWVFVANDCSPVP
jgi:hypothetical protein